MPSMCIYMGLLQPRISRDSQTDVAHLPLSAK